MEKEKILSGIVEKLGKTSFSNRTIEAYVSLNPLAEGTEPDEAWFTKAADFMKAMQGQYDHDVATGLEELKKNFNPDKPQPTVPETPKENKDIDELKKQLAALAKELKDGNEAKKQKELVESVRKQMMAKNATDEYVLDKTFQGVKLDSSKSEKDLVDDMMKLYDAEYKACRGNGALPRNPLGGQGGGKNAASDFFARKAQKEGWAKKSDK